MKPHSRSSNTPKNPNCRPRIPGLVLVLLTLVTGAFAWRRSGRSAAARAFRDLEDLTDPVEMAKYLNRLGMHLTLPRRTQLFDRVADRLERAPDSRKIMADGVRASARVLEGLGRGEPAARRQLASAMESWSNALEAVGERSSILRFKNTNLVAWPFALQVRLFAALLRAESQQDLFSLHSQLCEILPSQAEVSLPLPLYNQLLEELRDILGPYCNRASDEEEGLVLEQALERALQSQDRLGQLYAAKRTFSLAIAVTLFNSLSRLLATFGRDSG